MRRIAILTLAALPLAAWAGDSHHWRLDDRESIRRTFAVPGGAGKLLVDNLQGYIHVTGYGGTEVQVSVEKRIYAVSSGAMADAKRDVKLDISQQGGMVRVYEDGPFRDHNGNHHRSDHDYGYRVVFDIDVQVPTATELELKSLNSGIAVKKTTGDYSIHGLNGSIDMEDIAGAGTVNTLNGRVKVSFSRNPTKATQFKTLNGSVDVYFQQGLNADLKFKKLNGGIYTDFEVASVPRAGEAGGTNGRFVYRSGREQNGRAGKGGPEVSFDTLNGSIRLHTRSI